MSKLRSKQDRRYIKASAAEARKELKAEVPEWGAFRCLWCRRLNHSLQNNCVACGASIHIMYGEEYGFEPCGGVMLPTERRGSYGGGWFAHRCLGCGWVNQ